MQKKIICSLLFLPIIILLFSIGVCAEEYIFTVSSDFPMPYSTSIETVNARHGVYTTSNVEAIQPLIDAGLVNYCEPMSYSELFDYTTDDYYYNEQTNLAQISAQFAWNKNVFGEKVKIAVIDSGLYNAASDFNFDNIYKANDYTATASSDVSFCNDEIGHGTMVTGIIAAAHNTRGVAGIAPNVEIYVFKCFYLNESNNQTAKNSDIIAAIYEAIDTYDVDIINLSAGTTNKTIFKSAADYCEKKGVLLVSAAGNFGAYADQDKATALYYPASYDNVIGVGSIKADGHRASHSQRNDYVDIMAPGENIYSVRISGYEKGHGTSFATPQVVAAAALAKSLNPDLTAKELTEALYKTCNTMKDRYSGKGSLNIQALLTYVKSALSPGKLVYSVHNSNVSAYSTADYTVFKPTYEDSILTKLERTTYTPTDTSLLVWNMENFSPIETENY